ncbi:hypothetical protein P170DRAFT_461545 [Aspergillus steynii IBT 23096]|uniref:alpha-L-rhamnosidase n=1 Tax=Aspergillus steynii IBT 23096 TaxID=1392250 RepID=A0A2I2GSA0_9EURO|nr:uncharacterized protein P170DRAFT_461545 [Aspergillus steynii IBT 23096]PLB55755.1 hypothetical protein P170DRAFT_461545 [Aspergillus steynii IBT 23096]
MTSQPTLSPPTYEHHPSGFGIDHARPRISWTFQPAAFSEGIPEAESWQQSAYDIELHPEGSTTQIFHVESRESVLVPWPGQALNSRGAAKTRVRSYSQIGEVTSWSAWSPVEAGLLGRTDWTAGVIGAEEKFAVEGEGLRPVIFEKGFRLPGEMRDVVKARLYVTALGVYEARINGCRVGTDVMAPGWTSYHHRLVYQSYDVLGMLNQESTISLEVAEGWYAGRLGFGGGRRFIYGDEVGVLAQLEVTFGSGEMWTLGTDGEWKCRPSAIVKSEIYDGEVFDMRLEQDREAASYAVKPLPWPSAALIASDAPPVRVTQEVKATEILTSRSGKTIVDFGQNLVGVLRIRAVQVPAGDEIVLRYAEVLADGEIAMRPLRRAKCTDTIISSGEKLISWQPKFTFHGFRFVQVDGWPGMPSVDDFTALVMHTDMRRRGWFSCSDGQVNQLHENVVWSMRGNFLSIPTDCPQRDERLGWTGDIQVFSPTASFLFDTTGMLSNWLEDLSADQLSTEHGIPGLVVPEILWERRCVPTPQAVWHDAAILTPWDLYLASGDEDILRRQYESMRVWIDKAIRRGDDGLWTRNVWQLGDWLDPNAPPDDAGYGRTDGIFVADAYLVHITRTMAKIALVLNRMDDASRYRSNASHLTSRFQRKYLSSHGYLASDTQTAYALAIRFALLPDDANAYANAATRLSELVGAAKFHIGTGFVGTALICPALTDTKQGSLAYRMLLEKHCPSWLYPVTMGATTVWERWDSMHPDGTVNTGSMTSFNHYALGAIAGWLHETVGGISTVDGWRTVRVAPQPGGMITHAESAFYGPYGRVECRWEITGAIFTLELVIPPNSSAEVPR